MGRSKVVVVMPAYNAEVTLEKTWIDAGVCDVVLGDRVRTRREALSHGMPLWKYVANHTGLRVYARCVLETIPYHANSEDFVFDQEFLIQAVYFGFRIGDVPVPVRYLPESSSINFRRSVGYGLGTLRALLRFCSHRLGLTRDPLFLSPPPTTQVRAS